MFSALIAKSPLLKGLVDFVFPPLCLGCGAFADDPTSICPACLRRIETYAHPMCLLCFELLPNATTCPICRERSVPLLACGNYSPPLKDIIIQFKFRGITSPAGVFAALLVEQFQTPLQSFGDAVLVPVPLHPSRERHRGYNQATLFAREIGSLLDISVREDILSRTKKKKPQASLELGQRATNIRGVFVVAEQPDGCQKIMLVDDVVTSGATVIEARRVLEEAGSRVVAVLAMAHGR